jgi:hypothetical protein
LTGSTGSSSVDRVVSTLSVRSSVDVAATPAS